MWNHSLGLALGRTIGQKLTITEEKEQLKILHVVR